MSHGGVMSVDLCGFCCEYWCRCWSWTRILVLLLSAKAASSTAASLLMRLFNTIQSCSNNNSYDNCVNVCVICLLLGSSLRYRHHTWVKRRKPRQNSADNPHPQSIQQNAGKWRKVTEQSTKKTEIRFSNSCWNKAKVKDQRLVQHRVSNPPTGSL